MQTDRERVTHTQIAIALRVQWLYCTIPRIISEPWIVYNLWNRIYDPREGVIIECPLNGQYHDRRDVIITSRMAVSNNFITVTII